MRNTRNRSIGIVLSVVALVTALAWAGDQPPASDAKTAQVTIENFTFKPATITVPVGTTVTWTNRDDMPHTVVAEDRSFRSNALDTDETFSHTFNSAGTFVYFCSIHTSMVGKVIVETR